MTTFSLYHELRSQFKRSWEDKLLEETLLHGSALFQCLSSVPRNVAMHVAVAGHIFTSEHYRIRKNEQEILVNRYELTYDTHISGVLFWHHVKTQGALPDDGSLDMDFRAYFALILLSQPSSRAAPRLNLPLKAMQFATKYATTRASVARIVDVFEQHLLFRGPENDKWHSGQELFRQKVEYYAGQRARVRFCLPAFPCKSSNPDKVASLWPDGAEYEALTNLYTFVVAIEAVYPPGAVLEIVSDGHVFSDCVGVDDKTVSEYARRLQLMSADIRQHLEASLGRKCHNLVTFQGLREILHPARWTRLFMPASLNVVQHPIETARTL
jgi:Pyoverdine/dityrosine biosynthesis protein